MGTLQTFMGESKDMTEACPSENPKLQKPGNRVKVNGTSRIAWRNKYRNKWRDAGKGREQLADLVVDHRMGMAGHL